jgi:probable rRNA maturation factor
MSGLILRNRQRVRRINARLLKQIARALLAKLNGPEAELGIHLVAAPEMARLNETFLQHMGSTDVITFDYSPPAARHPSPIHGEIFICLDEALRQARRFRTTWQSEVVRYLVHGLLHLRGHDDSTPAARRRMKRAENRLLDRLAREFGLNGLAAATRGK